jgi:tetratricopeptide (TPR) repeat protein
MKIIELKHDQAQKTTTVLDDGAAIVLACLSAGEGLDVLDWKDRLFPELVAECRLGPGRGAELVFRGVEEDFKHIEAAFNDFIGQNAEDIEIQISYKGEIPVPVLKCRKCGFELKPNWIKCPKCKTPVAEEALKCQHCGEELEDWMDECPACGKPVKAAPAEQQPEAAPQSAQPAASGDVEKHKKRAKEFQKKKDFDSAIKELTEAIRINPNDAELYWLRADNYDIKGWHSQAIQDCFEAIRLRPEDDDAFFILESAAGSEALEKENTSDGELGRNVRKYFNQAVNLVPDSVTALVRRAKIYTEFGGDLDVAIADCTKAIQIDPNSAEAYRWRGIAYREQEKKKNALEDFDEAIRLAPDSYLVYASRGMAYFKWNDYGKAINDYTKALSLSPDSAAVYSERGKAFLYQDVYSPAIRDFSSAIEIDPDGAPYYVLRGNAYYYNGDSYSAAKDYDRALELDPDLDRDLICDKGYRR